MGQGRPKVRCSGNVDWLDRTDTSVWQVGVDMMLMTVGGSSCVVQEQNQPVRVALPAQNMRPDARTLDEKSLAVDRPWSILV